MRRPRRYGRHRVKSEINIVPLLDVLLVLLLIFMATAPIISQSVSVDLPQSSESKIVDSSDSQQAPVIVEVQSPGNYSIKIGNKKLERLPAGQITDEAKRQLIANKDTVFLIAGARDVPYNEIIRMVDVLRQAGVERVGLMSQPI